MDRLLRMDPARDNRDARCGDCLHLRNGCCEPAAEALAAAGWPGLVIRPRPQAWAGRCPGFQAGPDFEAALREAAEVRRAGMRAALARGFPLG